VGTEEESCLVFFSTTDAAPDLVLTEPEEVLVTVSFLETVRFLLAVRFAAFLDLELSGTSDSEDPSTSSTSDSSPSSSILNSLWSDSYPS
jgi:hypothetical protein